MKNFFIGLLGGVIGALIINATGSFWAIHSTDDPSTQTFVAQSIADGSSESQNLVNNDTQKILGDQAQETADSLIQEQDVNGGEFLKKKIQDEGGGGGGGSVDACSNINDIPYAECQALKDLYYSTNGKNWSNTNRKDQLWFSKNDATACDWYGIRCENNHVIIIDMPGNNLNGTLWSSISNLTVLKELILSNNKLTGPIPFDIGDNLNSLQHLNLGNNELNGSIPSSMCDGLPSLTDLYLNNNKLTGPICSFTRILHLNLSNNELTGPIPDSITNYYWASTIDLSNNKLTGPISDNINNIPHLGWLYLHNNQLCGYIPKIDNVPMSWFKYNVENNKLMTKGYSPEMSKWLLDIGFRFGFQNSTKCP